MLPLGRLFLTFAISFCWLTTSCVAAAPEVVRVGRLWAQNFDGEDYGCLPAGWIDLDPRPPSRGWIIDGDARLRFVHKLRTGVVAYDGYLCNGMKSAELADAELYCEFTKTLDAEVSFGIAGRIVDRHNYYLARFRGDNRLELLKVVNGREIALDSLPPNEGLPPRTPGLVTSERYRADARWELVLRLRGNRIEAVVQDDRGNEKAAIAAVDDQFTHGRFGLCCTPFAAAKGIWAYDPEEFVPAKTMEQIARRNRLDAAERPDYPVVKPRYSHRELNTPPDKIAAKYDVVVAGAGCGGWAAAIQAARLGAKVLLLEETDWIGGQMCAAAVTSMDEDGVRHTYAVRERGLYREFHESMTAYYHSLNKDPLVAYYGWPEQREGGYEPKVARAMLYGFLEHARREGSTLDVVLQARVVGVNKSGNQVTGVKLAIGVETGIEEQKPIERDVSCGVLIDATEYGDVIPLTGAKYRVGNTTSDRPDPASLVQDHTWTAVLQEYPNGVPDDLQIKEPPPGYADYAGKRYRKYRNEGPIIWGGAGKGIKGPRSWRAFFAWRGMADTESDLLGTMSSARHTQCGFNGGNDYPVTAATIEDPQQRLRDEREGIYRTLGALYYFQQELGVPWSLARDEGFDTPYQRAKIERLELRNDLQPLARHLPQQPYVRECRRIVGVKTLVAADLGRYEQAKLFPTSIAMGDYFMDLDHGKTAHAIEADLDGAATAAGQIPHGGGPFQVPLETLIPEKIDGFLAAEKNISQSRLVNGATRLQPITMLTGQAAGAVAALAVKQGVQPRELQPIEVQAVLLAAGSTLVQRWYSDVPWRSPIWQATQLLSLHGVMDRPMQIDDDPATPLGAEVEWGVDEPLKSAELQTALAKLAAFYGLAVPTTPANASKTVSIADLKAALVAVQPTWGELLKTKPLKLTSRGEADVVTAGEFALIAAAALRQSPAAR